MNKLSKVLISCLVVTMSSSAFAAASSSAVAATKLVNKVIGSQGQIVQTFPAVDGLIGFVVQSNQGNGSSGILYADTKGQYLFAGSIINAQGQDLTQQYTNQYINSKIAGPAYAQAVGLNYFTSGSDSAPHKAIIIIDPNCIFCHNLYQEVQPLIDAGQLQVRWLPVAFRDPSSPGKAAAMLNAGSDAAAGKLLAENEANFDTQTESGSLAPLQPDSKNASVTAAFDKVTQNTQFFSQAGFNGTPTILYKEANGNVMMVPGLPQGKAFDAMINSMGSNW